jgi:hypothetical protein
MCCERVSPCRASKGIRDLAKLLNGAVGGHGGIKKAIGVLVSALDGAGSSSADSNEHATALRDALEPFQQAVKINTSKVGGGWMSSSSDSDDDSDGEPDVQPPCPLRMVGNLTESASLRPAAAGDSSGSGAPAHCPPCFEDDRRSACNCISDHNHPSCVCGDGGCCEGMLEEELEEAERVSGDAGRDGNNMQRYRCYRSCNLELNGIGEQGVRHPLPNCLVSVIRMTWPEASGIYVGFKHA